MLNDLNNSTNVPTPNNNKKKIENDLANLQDQVNELENRISAEESKTSETLSNLTTNGLNVEVSANIKSLVSDKATINDVQSSTVTSSKVDTQNITSTSGTINNLNSTTIQTRNLEVTNNLQLNTVQANSAKASSLDVTNTIKSNKVETNSVETPNVTSTNVTSTKVTTDQTISKSVTSDSVTTKNLSVENDVNLKNITSDSITTKEANIDETTVKEADIDKIKNEYIRGKGTINVDPNFQVDSDWFTIYIPRYYSNHEVMLHGHYKQPDGTKQEWSITEVGTTYTSMFTWSQTSLETIREISFDKETGRVAIKVKAEDFVDYLVSYIDENEEELTAVLNGPGYETIYVPETHQGYTFQSYNDDTTDFYFGGRVSLHSLKATIQEFDWATYKNIGVQYNIRVPYAYDSETAKPLDGDDGWKGGDYGQYLTVRDVYYPELDMTIKQLVWENWIDQITGTINPEDRLITAKTLAFYDGTAATATDVDPIIEPTQSVLNVYSDLDPSLHNEIIYSAQDVEKYHGLKLVFTYPNNTIEVPAGWDSVTRYTSQAGDYKYVYLSFHYSETTPVTANVFGVYKVNSVWKSKNINAIPTSVQAFDDTRKYPIVHLGDETTTHGSHNIEEKLEVGDSIRNDLFYAGDSAADALGRKDGSILIRPDSKVYNQGIKLVGLDSKYQVSVDYGYLLSNDWSTFTTSTPSSEKVGTQGYSNLFIRYRKSDGSYPTVYYKGFWKYSDGKIYTHDNYDYYEITSTKYDTQSWVANELGKLATAPDDLFVDENKIISSSYTYLPNLSFRYEVLLYSDDNNKAVRKTTENNAEKYDELAVYESTATLENNKPVIYDEDHRSLKTTDELDIDSLNVNNLNVANDAVIGGDLYVKGTTHTVDEETISSTSDNIVLRQNNDSPLANNQLSGIIVNNYDGNGKVAIIGSDNKGTIRVGDSETTDTTFDVIYLKDGTWYNEDKEEIEVDGELVAYTSKSIDEDNYTKFEDAIFAEFDTNNTVPLLAREEAENLNDKALLKWNADKYIAEDIALPTKSEQTLESSYSTSRASVTKTIEEAVQDNSLFTTQLTIPISYIPTQSGMEINMSGSGMILEKVVHQNDEYIVNDSQVLQPTDSVTITYDKTELVYKWADKKAGSFVFNTQAEYEASSDNIPENSLITILEEDNYVFGDDK